MARLTIAVCCLLLLPAAVLDLFFGLLSVMGGGESWPLCRTLCAAISDANAKLERA